MSAVDYVIDAVDKPLHFGRRRRREDPEMDITPMIDITFLLLIFFLVATRLSSEGVVDLPRAKHGTAVAADSAVVITVTSGIGDEAFIFKGDGAFPETRLTSNDLAAQQDELETYIAEQLAGTKTQVLIKAEGHVRHRDIARIARAAGAAGSDGVRTMFVAVLEDA